MRQIALLFIMAAVLCLYSDPTQVITCDDKQDGVANLSPKWHGNQATGFRAANCVLKLGT